MLAYVPALQFTQAAAASALIDPVGQAVQTDAPDPLYFPARHDAQLAVPRLLATYPAAQDVHVPGPVLLLYFPRRHAVHDAAPAVVL